MKKSRYLFYIILLIVLASLYYFFLGFLGDNCTTLLQNDVFNIMFVNIVVMVFNTYFVIIPISKIIDNQKWQNIVKELFILKLILLFYQNFLCVEVAFLFECIVLFVCAVFIVPIIRFTKRVFFTCSFVYDEYLEVDLDSVRKYFSDIKLLKNSLMTKYFDMNAAVCNYEYKKLDKLCSSDFCLLCNNDMKLIEKSGNKKYFLDFVTKKSKIFRFNITKNDISIVLISKIKGYEYTIDKNNRVVEGSRHKKKNIIVKIYFSQKLYNKVIKECPNCGASASYKGVDECEYCGTLLNYKVDDLVITRVKRVYDK